MARCRHPIASCRRLSAAAHLNPRLHPFLDRGFPGLLPRELSEEPGLGQRAAAHHHRVHTRRHHLPARVRVREQVAVAHDRHAAAASATVIDHARDHAPVRGLGIAVRRRAPVDRQRCRPGVVEAARHLANVDLAPFRRQAHFDRHRQRAAARQTLHKARQPLGLAQESRTQVPTRCLVDGTATIQIDKVGTALSYNRRRTQALLEVIGRDLDAKKLLVGCTAQARLLLPVTLQQTAGVDHFTKAHLHPIVGTEPAKR